jgi:hypothetical protein
MSSNGDIMSILLWCGDDNDGDVMALSRVMTIVDDDDGRCDDRERPTTETMMIDDDTRR